MKEIKRICHKCKENKILTCFYKDSNRKLGYDYTCKLCRKKYDKKNKERRKLVQKAYREKNKEKIKKTIKKYKEENNKKIKQYRLEYYKKNKEKLLQYQKEYRKIEENRDKILSYKKEYYKNNKEKSLLAVKKWHKENNDKRNAIAAKYRANKLDQTPDMTKAEWKRIDNIYKKCSEISELTRIPHEVDHIKPISKGGLHHPDNLQILTRSKNRSKKDSQ